MVNAEYQKRWRDNTDRRRIEVYLPLAVVERLDEIASRRGQRRPAALAELIQSANLPAKQEARPEPQPDEPHPPAPATEAAMPAPVESPGMPQPEPYTLRKPRADNEKRYAWIVVTDDGPVCGLERNPKYGKRWRGHYLKKSWFTEWAYGDTRDEVTSNLLRLPELYQ